MQPIPLSFSLNYDDVFKIQHVHNPFALRPVSYSALASYLECPGCALEQKRKKRSKEPKQFSNVRQAMLFGKGEPDARLIGLFLHNLVNFLHDPRGPLTKEQQEVLLADSDKLVRFIRRDLLPILQKAGKLRLAMFFDELCVDEETLYTTIIAPMLRYQREFVATGAIVLAAAERFQFKLLSTRKTFADHSDWGGYVGLVGEFDQIRLRKLANTGPPDGIPAIMEFKKGLGGKKRTGSSPFALFVEQEAEESDMSPGTVLPGPSHAMQLMIYWMAFQTRWDIFEKLAEAKGLKEDIRMPVQQWLDLIIYNLNDGCQYRLLPTSQQEALQSLTSCIFYLDWAMKSGYAWQAPDHDCKKTQLLDVPNPTIQVGYTTLSAQECYLLAREAFDRFKDTVRWERFLPDEMR